MTQDHNHLADPVLVELKRMQGRVQLKSVSTRDQPRRILADEIVLMNNDARPFIRRSLVTRNVRRQRNEAHIEPPNPKCLEDLIVSLIY